MTPRALILGIGGQDGSLLAEHLLSKGYEVHGLYRHSTADNLQRVRSILDRITLHCGDLTDPESICRALVHSRAYEIYNLADQDHIGWSWDCPSQSLDVTGCAVLRLLESVDTDVRVFQPVSSTIYGSSPTQQTQDESCPLNPQSPYAVAKATALHLCRLWRERYGIWVSTGILYNHDSPRRAPGYLLDEIIDKVLLVKSGKADRIILRDPDSVVDIGFAGDYVDAMHRILQCYAPDDFIIATGIGYTVGAITSEILRLLDLPPSVPILKAVCSGPAQHVGQGTHLVGCAAKLTAATGWKAATALTELLTMKLESRAWKGTL
jgi:GDPmannose 4,6-dehydratase